MSDTLRLAVLGLSHDHVWNVLPTLRQTDGTQLVAAADPIEPLRSRIEREFGCPTYDGWRQLLDEVGLDAVLVYGDNRTSAQMATAAAERGLHVLKNPWRRTSPVPSNCSTRPQALARG